MCYDQSCLGYLLLAVLVGFAGLIYFSLRHRKIFLEKNLHISADQVWEGVAERAAQANLKKSDLLFGVKQDGSASVSILLIKNAGNEVVARIECPIASREYKMWVGEEIYRINFLLAGWRSAQLSPAANDSVLASYRELNIFGKHEFAIPGYGNLTSKRPILSWRLIFTYCMPNKLIGIKQRLSPSQDIGSLVVLPSEIPLYLRVFILAL